MAYGINKVILIGSVEATYEYANSRRDMWAAKNALINAFRLLTEGIPADCASDLARKLNELRDKLLRAISIIQHKLLRNKTNHQNSAVTLLVRNKLKPTDDGKDANVDKKAIKNTLRFFINYWNLIHAQHQDRAFTRNR